jgi:hypothetical protein
MMQTVLRSFSRLNDAENAKRLLITAGIRDEDIAIDARLDEAGGTEGNFVIGNGIEPPFKGPDRGTTGGTDYHTNFASVQWRGTILLLVDLNDEELKRAELVMSNVQGTDQNQMTR